MTHSIQRPQTRRSSTTCVLTNLFAMVFFFLLPDNGFQISIRSFWIEWWNLTCKVLLKSSILLSVSAGFVDVIGWKYIETVCSSLWGPISSHPSLINIYCTPKRIDTRSMLSKIVRIDLCLTRTILYGSVALDCSYCSLMSLGSWPNVSTQPGDNDEFMLFSTTDIASGSAGSWSFMVTYAHHFLFVFSFFPDTRLFAINIRFVCTWHSRTFTLSQIYSNPYSILWLSLRHTASFAWYWPNIGHN